MRYVTSFGLSLPSSVSACLKLFFQQPGGVESEHVTYPGGAALRLPAAVRNMPCGKYRSSHKLGD